MTKVLENKNGFKAVIDPVAGGFRVILARWDGEQWNALYNQNRRIFKTLAGAERYVACKLA